MKVKRPKYREPMIELEGEFEAKVWGTRQMGTGKGNGARKMEITLSVQGVASRPWGYSVTDAILMEHPDPKVLAIQRPKRDGWQKARAAHPELVMARLTSKGNRIQVRGYRPVANAEHPIDSASGAGGSQGGEG